MPIQDKDKLYAKLEEVGVQQVRVKLAQGVFARHKTALVKLGLSEKGKESRE